MNTEMTIRKVPVTALKPSKYNPRKDLKPGDPAYEKIKRSLHDFGYVDPVIWNEVTGNIVGGHQRYKVLTAEGATEINCVVVHIENPQDEKTLNIALNKAVGEWEPKALADLLSDLQLSGYDVGATGFDAAEVDELFSKVHDKDVKDDDTELDAETIVPFVKSGDRWTLGRHRMLCGDATSEDDLNHLMGDVKASYELIKEQLYGLKDLESELASISAEEEVAAELITQCIRENARVALNQEDYNTRYQALCDWHDAIQARLDSVEAEINRRRLRRSDIDRFIGDLMRQPAIIATFDPILWSTMVERVTIHGKNDLRFTFRNGTEITA